MKDTQEEYFKTDKDGHPCDIVFYFKPHIFVTCDDTTYHGDHDSVSTFGPKYMTTNSSETPNKDVEISVTDSKINHLAAQTDQNRLVIEGSILHNP